MTSRKFLFEEVLPEWLPLFPKAPPLLLLLLPVLLDRFCSKLVDICYSFVPIISILASKPVLSPATNFIFFKKFSESSS